MPQCDEAGVEEGNRSPSRVFYFSDLTRWFVKVILQEEAAAALINTDDLPPRAQSASDLLASVGDPPPSTEPTVPFTPTPVNTNPIHFTKAKDLAANKSSALNRLLQNSEQTKLRRAATRTRLSTDIGELTNHAMAADLSKQITRRWKAGDVYAPHDLSAAEMAKWKKREKPSHDVFDVLDFNPLEHYRVCPPCLLFWNGS